MLQYILTESPAYSVAELAQMAVEGGCGWIDLHLPGKDDAELRSLLMPDVVELCRQAGVFLTIDDNPAAARELGLHGVRFTKIPEEATPASLREELGPEAVIGIVTDDVDVMAAMVAADCDYACIPASLDDAGRRALVGEVRSRGLVLPLVAQGDITPETAPALLAEGFNGLAASSYITDAADPVEATAALLASIS